MGLRVRWSRQSREHLFALRERIRNDNPRAADRMRLHIRHVVKLLGVMPGIGRPGRRSGTMEFVVSPYIIVYRVMRAELRVIGIFHGAREEWEDFSGN
jgi:plasmid stabilization system protein ParE